MTSQRQIRLQSPLLPQHGPAPFMGQWTSCQAWALIQVFSIRTRAKNQLGTEAWYWQVTLQPESKGPPGRCHCDFLSSNGRQEAWVEKRTCKVIVFGLTLFFWRKQWVLVIEEKHFVCFPSSEPFSAVQRLVFIAFYQDLG